MYIHLKYGKRTSSRKNHGAVPFLLCSCSAQTDKNHTVGLLPRFDYYFRHPDHPRKKNETHFNIYHLSSLRARKSSIFFCWTRQGFLSALPETRAVALPSLFRHPSGLPQEGSLFLECSRRVFLATAFSDRARSWWFSNLLLRCFVFPISVFFITVRQATVKLISDYTYTAGALWERLEIINNLTSYTACSLSPWFVSAFCPPIHTRYTAHTQQHAQILHIARYTLTNKQTHNMTLHRRYHCTTPHTLHTRTPTHTHTHALHFLSLVVFMMIHEKLPIASGDE